MFFFKFWFYFILFCFIFHLLEQIFNSFSWIKIDSLTQPNFNRMRAFDWHAKRPIRFDMFLTSHSGVSL